MNVQVIKSHKITILRFIVQLLYFLTFFVAIISQNLMSLLILASAVLLGPIFCGWFCSFGFFQDVLRYFGQIFKKKPLEVDYKIHKYLRFSRYLILAGVAVAGGIFLFPDDIKHTLFKLLKGHISFNTAFWAFIVLGVLSLFAHRFYCRYLCPFGAKLGLLALFRLFTIKKDSSECISCKICSSKCPMHIEVDKINNLFNPNCVNCFRCIENCPKKCLKLGLRNYLKP